MRRAEWAGRGQHTALGMNAWQAASQASALARIEGESHEASGDSGTDDSGAETC